MTNEEIAKIVAKKVFEPSKDDESFAIQLFVEAMVLPTYTATYTLSDMERYILSTLKSPK